VQSKRASSAAPAAAWPPPAPLAFKEQASTELGASTCYLGPTLVFALPNLIVCLLVALELGHRASARDAQAGFRHVATSRQATRSEETVAIALASCAQGTPPALATSTSAMTLHRDACAPVMGSLAGRMSVALPIRKNTDAEHR
jgi:hypothetical protein